MYCERMSRPTAAAQPAITAGTTPPGEPAFVRPRLAVAHTPAGQRPSQPEGERERERERRDPSGSSDDQPELRRVFAKRSEQRREQHRQRLPGRPPGGHELQMDDLPSPDDPRPRVVGRRRRETAGRPPPGRARRRRIPRNALPRDAARKSPHRRPEPVQFVSRLRGPASYTGRTVSAGRLALQGRAPESAESGCPGARMRAMLANPGPLGLRDDHHRGAAGGGERSARDLCEHARRRGGRPDAVLARALVRGVHATPGRARRTAETPRPHSRRWPTNFRSSSVRRFRCGALVICWLAGAKLATAVAVATWTSAAVVVIIEIAVGVRERLAPRDFAAQAALGMVLGLLVIALRTLLH